MDKLIKIIVAVEAARAASGYLGACRLYASWHKPHIVNARYCEREETEAAS